MSAFQIKNFISNLITRCPMPLVKFKKYANLMIKIGNGIIPFLCIVLISIIVSMSIKPELTIYMTLLGVIGAFILQVIMELEDYAQENEKKEKINQVKNIKAWLIENKDNEILYKIELILKLSLDFNNYTFSDIENTLKIINKKTVSDYTIDYIVNLSSSENHDSLLTSFLEENNPLVQLNIFELENKIREQLTKQINKLQTMDEVSEMAQMLKSMKNEKNNQVLSLSL